MLVNQIQTILKEFDIEEAVISIEVLQETKCDSAERMVYRVKTEQAGDWVVRLSSESQYTKELVEQQSTFAMMLFSRGMKTPRKLLSTSGYCVETELNQKKYRVTVEEFLGEDWQEKTEESFFVLGRILGKMHRLSEKYPQKIDFSIVRKNIISQNVSFGSVLKNTNFPLAGFAGIEEIAKMHDELIRKLSTVWESLPHGAVQGDLGIYNNLVDAGHGIGIIDYNLAGDEVYLGDMLATLYSSLYMMSVDAKEEEFSATKAKEYFLQGYFSERSLGEIEQKYYLETEALFNGLFYCRVLLMKWKNTENYKYLDLLMEAKERFACKELRKH